MWRSGWCPTAAAAAQWDLNSLVCGAVCYLQLLLLKHIRPRCVQDVVGQLSLAIYVDRRRGFAGQEAVVDFSSTLRELEETWASGRMKHCGEKSDKITKD